MTDITKCRGTNCPLKEDCYRYLAKEDVYQSNFMRVPYIDGKCNFYWKRDGQPKKKNSLRQGEESYREL